MCMAEMVTYLPISSPFIRFAGRYVDEAFGFAAGWNFFVFEAILVPFEITACNVIIHYWSDALPTGATVAIVLVLYGVINLVNVKWYGEVEFWAALGTRAHHRAGLDDGAGLGLASVLLCDDRS